MTTRVDGLGPDDKFLGLLRSDSPPLIEPAYGQSAWVATRYEDVKRVLSDQRFGRIIHEDQTTPRSHRHPRSGRSLATLSGEEHRRLRRLIAPSFSPKRAAQMQPRVEEIVAACIDEIEAQSQFDLVSCFAFPVPVRVVCTMFGVDSTTEEEFSRWTRVLISGAAHSVEEMNQAHHEMMSYFREQISDRRNRPRNPPDILSELVHAADDAGSIAEEDLLELAVVILASGYETTARQLAASLLVLLLDGSAWDLLASQAVPMESAVEELLRYIQLGNGLGRARQANDDVEMTFGVIRKGEFVFIGGGADNFDETVFESPTVLDLTRSPNPHLQFGHGPHFCAGASFARVELTVALREITRRLPNLSIVNFELEPRGHLLMRGPRSLIVTTSRRPA